MNLRRQHDPFKSDALPLFAWADRREKRVRLSPPARWIRRHYGLPPELARLVADLAGLGARHE